MYKLFTRVKYKDFVTYSYLQALLNAQLQLNEDETDHCLHPHAFDHVYRNLFDKISNYWPFRRMGGRLFEGVGLFEALRYVCRNGLNKHPGAYMII